MKIIHLISGGDVGGAKTHVLSLLQGLGRTQTVRLICFTEGPFAQEARALGIDTQVLAVGVGESLRTLAATIRAEGFEIVHCHGARANMMGAILRRMVDVPTVTTVHSDYRRDYIGRPLSRLSYGTINTVALRLLDYHIGVSDAMTQMLILRGFAPQSPQQDMVRASRLCRSAPCWAATLRARCACGCAARTARTTRRPAWWRS